MRIQSRSNFIGFLEAKQEGKGAPSCPYLTGAVILLL